MACSEAGVVVLAVAEIACSEVGVGVLLELGAELGGTTCVPVATSPDSEDVRWMGWSLDDSAEVVRVVGCTEGAAVVGCTGGRSLGWK